MADVSLIICTHNRAESLSRTLQSCCYIQLPNKFDWELIVVANACTDDTLQVVENFRTCLPLKVVEEPVPGLSRARNAGVHVACSNLVVFTDDDVEIDPNCLAVYVEGAKKYLKAVFFGGQIIPKYNGKRPSWLTDKLENGVLSAVCVSRRMGENSLKYSKHQLPYGANFSVSREYLLQRPFRTDLGVIGNKKRCHEEVDLFLSLMKKGHHGVYLPGAIVWHYTDASRLKLFSIIRQGYGHGRSDIVGDMVERPDTSHWLYWLLKMYKLCLKSMFYLMNGCLQGHELFYQNIWVIARQWGRFHEGIRSDMENHY